MPEKKEIEHHHTKRDAETMEVLGIFQAIMAVPVLVGTLWADNSHSAIVNVAAGLTLLGVGVGFFVRGRWTRRHLD